MRKLLFALSAALVAVAGSPVAAQDCNNNAVPDATDIRQGTSFDCNSNRVPDECDTAIEFTSHVIGIADGPQGLDLVDIDADGDIDVLAASGEDDRVVLFTNQAGSGSFDAAQPISIASDFAVSVVAADLDGDDDPDVLTASAADDTIAWYENTDGQGTFGAEQVISAAADGAWSAVAVDADGDGDLDVLATSQNDNTVAWYENTDGLGTFGPEQVIAIDAIEVLAAVAADLDGDGDLDAVSASFCDDSIAWYENTDGQGLFGPTQEVSSNAAGAGSVVTVDVDGDGDLDLLSASGFDDKIAWYEKIDGLDQFGPEQIITVMGDFPLWIHVTDMDADGDPDVLSASFQGNQVAWYENDGAGGFGPAREISASVMGAANVHSADIDNDGDTDVVSAAFVGDRVEWHENTGDDCNGNQVPDECEPDCNGNGIADDCDLAAGSSRDCNDNQVPDECDIASLASDDCTADGVPDECEPDCNANMQADSCDIDDLSSPDCTANGVPDECEPDCNTNSEADTCDLQSGASLDCNVNLVPDECDVAGMTAPDCNADGVPDTCEIEIVFTRHVISTQANFARAVLAADLDGDGDLDVVSASGLDDKVAWYENTDGAGGYGSQQVISQAGDFPLSIFAADIDGDADLDVVSASLVNNLIAWHPNTDAQGTFGSHVVVSATSDRPRSVVAADLDGDLDADLITASRDDDTVGWYENTDGRGSFGPRQVISATAVAARSVVAVDLDGDLDLDVLSASTDDDKIAWYENTDGAGTFGVEQVISLAADAATQAIAADLDGDLDLDVLTASQDDDKIAWHENTDGLGTFGPQQVISQSTNGPFAVFAGDVDGDGDEDILVASFFDGRVSWLENVDGLGAFGSPRDVAPVFDGAVAVIAADLDRDGDLDVLTASQYDDTIAWFENETNDCNGNGIPDGCDIASATSDDCSGNGIPDECEPDCNGNLQADSCDIFTSASDDCNANGLPDECEPDCNGNSQADSCDLFTSTSADCNGTGIPDECDLAGGVSEDCTANGIPDECEPDCNANMLPDPCEVQDMVVDDCNGNEVPDECDVAQTDCNTNGVPDDCDLLSISVDCNGNNVPDECDTGCDPPCDADGDACIDPLDQDPFDPMACADTDHDGCDDCRSGSFSTMFDGADSDGDGACNSGDCAPNDGAVWAEPGPTLGLALSKLPGMTRLGWQPPALPGADSVRYDTLRSVTAWDFVALGVCIETDGGDTSTDELDDPGADTVFYYLIRSENDCPGGTGSLGSASDGTPRTGLTCP